MEYYTAVVLADRGLAVNYKILGCFDTFVSMVNAEYLYKEYEYDTEGLIKNIKEILKF